VFSVLTADVLNHNLMLVRLIVVSLMLVNQIAVSQIAESLMLVNQRIHVMVSAAHMIRSVRMAHVFLKIHVLE
jgi:hypothetical protein